jgi:hypothetical protein
LPIDIDKSCIFAIIYKEAWWFTHGWKNLWLLVNPYIYMKKLFTFFVIAICMVAVKAYSQNTGFIKDSVRAGDMYKIGIHPVLPPLGTEPWSTVITTDTPPAIMYIFITGVTDSVTGIIYYDAKVPADEYHGQKYHNVGQMRFTAYPMLGYMAVPIDEGIYFMYEGRNVAFADAAKVVALGMPLNLLRVGIKEKWTLEVITKTNLTTLIYPKPHTNKSIWSGGW